ncbi:MULTISPECIES: response regulator transcription factor [unclassified Sporosarcina]|uniref:response regulator transcription factor n=1 Tax=unclassified Sporosarcina TaxID=2647733 RepID=UPI002082D350|nr:MULTISPECIES: response regulator transcription factor [unclassified Sporosarcina]GKV66194.1 DNA-binding response regulator [Sporosarcina sp. NCCP-2331]GLB56198.1 DNA-binding response regulator [Sporosarcina sp. NCCP-2378]
MEIDRTILIIEDEESILDILAYAIRREGFRVHGAATGQEGLHLFDGIAPDLVILDLMLPDMTGFDICKKITAASNVPILMLTARDDIVDKIIGLELGADDYMTKPFDVREVMARVKVLLRRQERISRSSYLNVNEQIQIEPRSHTVLKDGQAVALKPKEYELLLLFAQNRNQVFSREEILDTIWDFSYDGDIRTVDVHVQRVRKKLNDPRFPSVIETVFGIGYKMRGE